MVSFKMRRVLYSAAIGAEEITKLKKEEKEQLGELEKQVLLAKKIMSSIEQNKHSDPAMVIRLEGKLRTLEKKIKEKKKLSFIR